MPDWYTFSMIMKRLGENPERYYYSIATKDDLRMESLIEEMTSYARRNEMDLIAKRVEELENDPMFKKEFYRAKLLQFKAAYLSSEFYKDCNPKEALNVLMEFFRIIRTDFDIEKIDTYILTYNEMTAVNTLAIIYIRLYGEEKGLEVLYKLRANMERGYIDEYTRKALYLAVLDNIGRNTMELGKYDDCLEACEIGLPLAKVYNDINFFGRFLTLKAYCLLKLNRTEEGIECYKQACYIYIGFDMKRELESFTKICEMQLGIKIELNHLIPVISMN